jgi:hypothetical protein
VIIDPAGYVVGTASGEGNYDGFEQAIEAVVRVFDERGEIDRKPLQGKLEMQGVADTTLKFPGKVLASRIACSSASSRGRLRRTDHCHRRDIARHGPVLFIAMLERHRRKNLRR